MMAYECLVNAWCTCGTIFSAEFPPERIQFTRTTAILLTKPAFNMVINWWCTSNPTTASDWNSSVDAALGRDFMLCLVWSNETGAETSNSPHSHITVCVPLLPPFLSLTCHCNSPLLGGKANSWKMVSFPRISKLIVVTVELRSC